MFPTAEDIYRLAPELVLGAFGILIMLADPFVSRKGKGAMPRLALVGAILALASVVLPAAHRGTAFSQLIRIDDFSLFLHLVILGVAVLIILGSFDYLERENIQHGEYYALILFGTVGMGVMASANELMTAFIGLEISSISTYILAG